MADFWLRYDDFKGGDWGVLDPARSNADQFSAVNTSLYRSGLVGPRAGLKPLPVTGLPTHPIVPGPMGFAVFNTNLLIVLSRVYAVPLTGGAAVAWAPYAAPAVTPVDFAQFNKVMYSLVDGVVYKHNGAAATTLIATPAPLSFFVRWNYWLVGVDRNRPWRIWYTELTPGGDANPNVWPAGNYLDIGVNDPITALVPTYNALNVGKKEGWWLISGVLGDGQSVRDIVIGNGPIDRRHTTVTTDNRIIYWPVEHVPAWYNGERVQLEDEQRMDPRELPFTCDAVAVTPTGRRLVLSGDDPGVGTELLTWKEGVWTRHKSAVRLGGLAPSDVRAGYDMPEHVMYAVERPVTIGDPVVIATLQHDLPRPGHASDQYASPTDPGSTALISGSFTLPAWYDPQGRQVTVRTLIVQFRKFPSGIAETFNRIRAQIIALGPYGRGREPGDPHNWIQPCEQAPFGGTDESWRVNMGEQGAGNGFLINFPVLNGVAIREVIVGVSVRSERS